MNPTSSTHRRTERLQPDGSGIERAARLLSQGRLVAFPTETVYGLGADGRDGAAVAALYAAKGRPAFNPLIAHIADLPAALREGVLSADASRLAEAFWPGPLTLVVPRRPGGSVCDLARSGLDTVGLRVPRHPLAHALLARCGFPVVAPSANLSGRISPTTAVDVQADLDGRIDAVMTAGVAEVGVESTILACVEGDVRLLRPGGVPREEIEERLGRTIAGAGLSAEAPMAPGSLPSHYAPRARLRLDAADVRAGEAWLAFGTHAPSEGAVAQTRNLSPDGDLVQAAANLFAHLRALDAAGVATIAVAPIPESGLGEAINDRLRRAAAPR